MPELTAIEAEVRTSSPAVETKSADLLIATPVQDVVIVAPNPSLSSIGEAGREDTLSAAYYLEPPMPSIVAAQTISPSPASDSPGVGNDAYSLARSYLEAIYRGDGEGAWRYAYVPHNPKQTWWNDRAAKGALLIRADSSHDLAAEKQGVRDINIRTLEENGDNIRLEAYVSYGNGSSQRYSLLLSRQSGQWKVAQE